MKSIDHIKIITFGVKSFFILLLLLSLISLSVLWYYSYEEFTSLLLKLYGKSEKIAEFRSEFLTVTRFVFLKYTLALLSVLLFFCIMKLRTISEFFSAKIISVLNSVKLFLNYLLEPYRKLEAYKKISFWIMIAFIGIVKLFFLNRFPFHVDELSSYLFIVKKGFFVTISYYPSPNNHIFYSLITSLVQPLFSDPYYLMKVPSFIFSILTSIILFFFLLRNFNFSSSILGTLLFSFMTSYFFYSISGRGYALMTSFTIVTTFMTMEIISGRNEKFLWHIYALCTILGFYTLVIFLYPFVTLSLVIAGYIIYERKYELIKTFIYYNLLIIAGVLLLYMPVFLISGISSITSNPWMIKLDWQIYFSLLPKFIKGAFEFILGIDKFALAIGVIIIISGLLVLLIEKKKTWFWLLVSFFIVPLILLTIQRLQPYNRVWCYLIFPTSLCLIFVWDYLVSFFSKIKYAQVFLTSVFALIIIGYTINYFYEMTAHGFIMYDNVDRITKYIVSENNVKVYTNDDSYNLFLRYHSSQIGKNVVPEMNTLPENKNFNYVLLTKNASFPATINEADYKLKEQDDFIRVYKHK